MDFAGWISLESFRSLGKRCDHVLKIPIHREIVKLQDFIQNSLGELVSLWVLNESFDKRSSVGVAIVEMGRLETWLLRHARGELDLHNAFGSRTQNLLISQHNFPFHPFRCYYDSTLSAPKRRVYSLPLNFRSR